MAERVPNRVGLVASRRPGETRVAAYPLDGAPADRARLRRRRRVRSGRRVGLRRHRVRRGRCRDRRRPGGVGGRTSSSRSTPLTPEEIAALSDGATLVSLVRPALNPDLVDALAERPITVLAMDAVPRISRAQPLDVLSSMANIAGYRAVIEAVHVFGRFSHRPGDRGRQGAAGEGARRRRRRGRAGRDRRGEQPGRDRPGHRPAPRGRRPGQVAGRGVPRGRRRAGGQHATATRRRRPRTTIAAPRRCTPSRPPTSTSSSPPR